jgi:hypothetical protein
VSSSPPIRSLIFTPKDISLPCSCVPPALESSGLLSSFDWLDPAGRHTRTYVTYPNLAQPRFRTLELAKDGSARLQLKQATPLMPLFQSLGMIHPFPFLPASVPYRCM